MARADSEQLLWEFAVGVQEPMVDDPFYRWLHDDDSVRIDWSTFGIEKLHSESPLQIQAGDAANAAPRP